jgi:hypothetical protein
MSHFLTFVFVEPQEDDHARRAEELMTPYFHAGGAYNSGNPMTKCDGFFIGGRYDQEIFGVEPMYNLTPDQFEERYGFDVVKAKNNIRLAPEVPRQLIPYAIVRPDGSWLDCERKAKAEWASEVGEVLQRYGEHYVVAVDCHC